MFKTLAGAGKQNEDLKTFQASGKIEKKRLIS